MVCLKPVTRENLDAVLRLKVREDQRAWVSTPAESLAQAWVYRETAYPFAVCDGDEVVGFIMMGFYGEKQYYTLWKLLIGREYQHRGYGRKALELGIAYLKETFGVTEIYTGVTPGNTAAAALYRSVGFTATGLVENNMEEMRLECRGSGSSGPGASAGAQSGPDGGRRRGTAGLQPGVESGLQPAKGTKGQERNKTMKTREINLRDPFVLVENGRYYLYGTRGETAFAPEASGFDVYIGTDLEEWEGPLEVFRRPEGFWSDRCFWAPEVHRWRGALWMFATFGAGEEALGTAILRAERPEGPFVPWSDRMVTPAQWRCLDGTLHVDRDGRPWMVFCREWTQIGDGAVYAMPLREDFTAAAGEPVLLFRASQGEPVIRPFRPGCYVTDGPFLTCTEDGRLHMLWSSFGQGGYVQALAHSDNDEIDGCWSVDPQLLFDRDGGHGMLFRTMSGEEMLTLHQPNRPREERPVFLPAVYDPAAGQWRTKAGTAAFPQGQPPASSGE